MLKTDNIFKRLVNDIYIGGRDLNEQHQDITVLENIIKEMRNEICLNCGKYKNEHEGACKGCKYEN